MVTGPSVMPAASLDRVLPVQGHTTMASTRPLGPMGSVSGMVWSTGRPAISWAFWIKLTAVPKRVSVS